MSLTMWDFHRSSIGVGPLPGLPPYTPHHHPPPPMSPKNCLHLIIKKAVGDADHEALDTQYRQLIFVLPPPGYLRGEKGRPGYLEDSVGCYVLFPLWSNHGDQVANA